MKRVHLIVISAVIILCMLLFSMYRSFIKDHDTNFMFSHKSGKQTLPVLKDELSLTDNQYNAIYNIFDRDSSAENEFRIKYLEKIDEMNSLIKNPVFDEKNIRKVMGEISRLKTEMTVIRFRQRSEIAKLLTPEQRIILDTKLTEKMKKYRDRHSGNTEGAAVK